MAANPASLQDWLNWQEQLSPKGIDLGLDRVGEVWQRLNPSQTLPFSVVTIAGTNGKGSCIAMLEAIFLAAGYRTGRYVSPHLTVYNERIHLNGTMVSDDLLCQAFASVEKARHETRLTYFEFGTLAAMQVFLSAPLDVVLLEVGLGGRLDAVNLFDAEAALVTTVDFDHQDYLGHDLELIGYEKAGIFRSGAIAVYGDATPPTSLLQHAVQLGTKLYCCGRDFVYGALTTQKSGWIWHGEQWRFHNVPWPRLPGIHQVQNASSVLMLVEALNSRLPVSAEACFQGIRSAYLPGRMQLIHDRDVTWVLDVAHNPQAARTLAKTLTSSFSDYNGRTLSVFGALEDKAIEEMVSVMDEVVDQWYLGGLTVSRGLTVDKLHQRVSSAMVTKPVQPYATLIEAQQAARRDANRGDTIVVWGSFHTVAQVLSSLSEGVMA